MIEWTQHSTKRLTGKQLNILFTKLTTLVTVKKTYVFTVLHININ